MLSGFSVELPWLQPIFALIHPKKRLVAAARAALAESRNEGYASGRGRTTIFAKMIAAGEGDVLTSDQMEREAKQFVVAGSDTTAVTLTYLVYAVLSAAYGVRQDSSKSSVTLKGTSRRKKRQEFLTSL